MNTKTSIQDQYGEAASDGQKLASPPSISLPKGGGAIRGIGEKFAANPVTGTGSMSVPIATSPGRGGFGPQLSLAYDSGSGNGPFGFGWSLSLPSITRKTDKGLPQYQDAAESDVFILSGAEDLVPEFERDAGGNWVIESGKHKVHDRPRTVNGVIYNIRRYRPRIEGLFARIERWTRQNDGNVHWRSISRDNILTLYGQDNSSRIFDPDDPQHIFSWLICESRDDRGNAVVYEYKLEDGVGVDLTQAHEHNRGDRNSPRRKTNRYIKHIYYGNRVPLLDAGVRPRLLTKEKIDNAGWMFEVVFDYGEHDASEPHPSDDSTNPATKSITWPSRNDPFSTYRAGFEVRTYRLCQRVLMFHHIPDLPSGEKGYEGLVRSTDFTYLYEEKPVDARNPIYSFLLSVTQSGYKRDNGSYLKRSLPPVEYEYTRPIVQDTVQDVDAASLENLPIGVDGASYQWTDLHGEGIPGILTEQAGAWFYKRNLSLISERLVEFAPLERVATKPNLTLAGGQAQFMDLAGDGQPDLVVLDGAMPGLYEHDGDESWQPFRPFPARLNRDMRDPNLKFVDLDGDGHADVFISEDDAFVWHTSLAEQGFGPARRVHQALDEEKGPRLVFADGTQSIYLADLSGDGLTDLVRIRNDEVCYWPNLGYGRFGAKVTMDHAPHFDNPDQFDHKRIRLADIDGSGTTDIIYLHRDGVRLYFNQSGNSWSAPQFLRVFPRVDDLVAITPTDLFGNGTACLVWSSPLPDDARRQMRYVNLMGGQKPHLLVKSVNNLGAETRVQYAPSTKFYLQDKYDGTPWITRLPFPVHVVERVETYDHISRNRFVTHYAYHHGYFDGEEREFRGFGMVEQWDAEEFAALSQSDDFPAGDNINAASHVPPVLTRTWFQTGAFIGRDHISNFFAGLLDEHDQGEYYREPGLNDTQAGALLLADTVPPDGLSAEEEREACRGLKGAMLRQEIYALDGTSKEHHPYTVTEQNFTIERLQPRAGNRHAVFFTHPREAISYHYERNPVDPRIGHALTLEVDGYGDVLKSITIGYGRRQGQSPLSGDDKKKQEQTLITYTENDVTDPIDDPAVYPDDYRTPRPCESRTYEITGLNFPPGRNRFTFDDVLNAGTGAAPIDYEQSMTSGILQKRLIEKIRTLYRRNDLTGPLPLGDLHSLALPFEGYKLAFTPGLLTGVFGGRVTNAMLDTEGRYVHSEGDANWWIPSGKVFFDVNTDVTNPTNTAAQELLEASDHFFLPRKFTDPFNHSATVEYDDHDLIVAKTQDAVGNTVTAQHDYRVLQPRLVSDPNGNRSEAAFDTLGMLVGTAVMGKPLPAPVEGDSLKDFQADLAQTQIDGFYDAPDPHVPALNLDLLKGATTRIIYDLDRFQKTRQAHPADPAQWLPVYAATLARETHASDPLPPQGLKIQINFSYSDGFGREIQKKIQAESGEVEIEDAAGNITVVDTTPNLRWVGSGWTIFNNKGKPVRQYEPFFSTHHQFQFGKKVGVSPILFYDPVERVVATLHPNHTYEKVVFDPWQQATYDINDTVLSADGSTDPKSDENVKGFFSRLSEADYLPTWYDQRIALAANNPERIAADKAAVHRQTPTIAHFDSLGRTFLTIADNGPAGKYETRVELDIENNQRSVTDALGRKVMSYDYDMLSAKIHQNSMDAGERWMINDVTSKPIRAWDSRSHEFSYRYDVLRRPTETRVSGGDGPAPLDNIYERIIYGEGQSLNGKSDQELNLRGKPFVHYDTAGKVQFEAYDFKGNLLRTTRKLLQNYKENVNWAQVPAPPLEADIFTSGTAYDALNRPVQIIAPHSDQTNPLRINIVQPAYNEANLLESIAVWLNQAGEPTDLLNPATAPLSDPGVKNIDYNAKGQRTKIEYKNGATTAYTYDADTFRLVRLQTTRPAGLNGLASQLFVNPTTVQDLQYTYDPVGNITKITDDAVPTIQYNNEQVDPNADYIYDAIYRLISAHGREHVGQTAFNFAPLQNNYRDYPFEGLGTNPYNPQAVRNYTETYDYDEVGNINNVQHSATGGSWSRTYTYSEPSLLEAGKNNNRLTRTAIGNGINFPEIYSYTDAQGNDVHGCMTSINSMQMDWDFKDQLQTVALGGSGTAYYVYDAAGQRVRKVIERQNGTKQKERIYLGAFELYREYNGASGAVDLERETLHIMDDKQRIALVETRTDTVVPEQLIRYQFGNHLGSASLELDNQAQIISYEEYTPYGSTAYQAVRSQTETPKRYRYTGKERDEESGLYYHGARYYAPWLGRWVSSDPIGIADGTNTYSYVQDNPVRAVDYNGTAAAEVVNPESNLVKGISQPKVISEGGKGVFQAPAPGITKPRITQDVATGKEVPVTGSKSSVVQRPAATTNRTSRRVSSPGPALIGVLLQAQLMKDLDTLLATLEYQEAMTLPGPEGYGQRIPKFLPGVALGPMSFPSANAVYAVINDPESRQPQSAPGVDTSDASMELGRPSKARRNEHESWGYYWNPFTNDIEFSREKMETDHIYPEIKIMELIEAFGEGSLTAEQVFLVKNYPGNFQPLPKSLNASKKDRTADQWQEALGVSFDPQYIRDMVKLENTIGQELINQILRFKANNARSEKESVQLRRLPAKWR